MSDEERANKMASLREQLNIELHRKFEQEVGYPVPAIHHAEIFAVDTASKYIDEVRIDEFQAGVLKLVLMKFRTSPQIYDFTVRVVSKLLEEMVPAVTRTRVSIQGFGNHEPIPVYAGQDLTWILLAAAYATTSYCAKEVWGTERDFLVAEYAFTVFKIPLDEILGKYECHVYDGKPEKNDWHYVTISRVSDAVIEWANKAGSRWRLTVTQERTKLLVGPDCTYFEKGYTVATVVWEGNQVSGLVGPNGEFYKKSE
jgi:hypothetical protein